MSLASVSLRPARKSDLDFLEACFAETWHAHAEEQPDIFKAENLKAAQKAAFRYSFHGLDDIDLTEAVNLAVAEIGSKIIGYVAVTYNSGVPKAGYDATISDIWVSEDWRGNGASQKLFERSRFDEQYRTYSLPLNHPRAEETRKAESSEGLNQRTVLIVISALAVLALAMALLG